MDVIATFVSGAVMALVLRSFMLRNKDTKKLCQNSLQVSDIDFDDLSEKIESLSLMKEQLYELENMITEIESAEQGERGITFNLSMPTADNEYKFLVNNSSDEMLSLLYKERKKLRFSIVDELSKIQIRSNANVTQTLKKSTDRGGVCNG